MKLVQIGTQDDYIDLDNICTLKIRKTLNFDYMYVNGVEIKVENKKDTENFLQHWFERNSALNVTLIAKTDTYP